jgi:hypothetical protein
MSEANKELVRRRFEEIFALQATRLSNAMRGDGDMQRRVLLGVWQMARGLESRREEHRCRRW